MNYLNLEISVLHSPEYIGSKPISRATWLNILMWCAGQENGGRIVGARAWGNRQWQQTCGVTLKEIEGAKPLLCWDNEDLVVFKYPSESEASLRAKREAGREGGKRSGEARGQKPRSTPSSTASPDASRLASTEGNGKEGNEMERKERTDAPRDFVFSATVMPDLETWLLRILGPEPRDEWEEDWWTKQWTREAGSKWKRRGGREILDWCIHQDGFINYFRSAQADRAEKNAPPDTAEFEADLERQRIAREAAEEKVRAEFQAALAGDRE